jgi:PAS domain S-box-containing protein
MHDPPPGATHPRDAEYGAPDDPAPGRESTDTLGVLFASSPLPIWVFDRQTLRFLEVNRAAVEHYGYSRDEFLAMTVADIRPEEDQGLLRAALADTREGIIYRGRHRHLARDGRVLEVEVSSQEVRFRGRDARAVVIHDLTDRIRAETALRESEERWRALVEVDPGGIVVMDEESVVRAANPAVERILGHPPDALIGRSLEVIVPARLRHAHRNGVQRYLQSGRRNIPWTGIELPALHRDGHEVPVEIAFGEYTLGDEHLFAGFIQDISDRKREQARRSAEHGVSRILSAGLSELVPERVLETVGRSLDWSFGGFWQPDPQGRELRCEATWHDPDHDLEAFARASRGASLAPGQGLPGRVWRSGQADWIQDVVEDRNFPRSAAAAACGLHTAFAFPVSTGREVLGVIEFLTRSKGRLDEPLLASMAAIGSELGQYALRQSAERERDEALAQALEARRRAEAHAARLEELQAELELSNDELQRVNEELSARTRDAERARALAESANQSKSAFLANMSHELRTPLNAITGYAELLALGIPGPINPKQSQHLERIRSSTDHLLRLINEILDLAKVESGQMNIRRERVSVPGIVHDALALIGPQAEKSGVELRNGVAAGNPCDCWGDEVRVRQILVNLLANGVKFTERGGSVRVSCRFASEPDPDARLVGEGPWTVIEVEDTGVGIPPEKRKDIFAAFVQVDPSHTREKGGTGLGLTIGLRMARLMDGDLTVRSEVGRGSCFRLWLPAGTVEVGEEGGGAWPRAPHRVPLLAVAGRTLARSSERIVRTLVERIRSDPARRGARPPAPIQLANHLESLLVELGLYLVALEEDASAGRMARDGADIQRMIAGLHGAQRAGLAWTSDDVAQEFAILRELTDATLRQRLDEPAGGTADEALGVVTRLLEQAETSSLRGWSRAAEHPPGGGQIA